MDRKPSSRSPVHVVYGGAHLFKADTRPRTGWYFFRLGLDCGAFGEAEIKKATSLSAKEVRGLEFRF